MIAEQLVSKYPKLYHMADNDSWPNIKEHGLLSTSSLLDKWEYTGKEREPIESHHRPETVCILHKIHGKAVIRDQKAIDPRKLRGCLIDMSEEEWYRLLNSKVFFWPDWQGLIWFLGATAYINKPHVVITIDTRRLLRQYANEITLSPINTGSTFLRKNHDSPEPRGRGTFKRISEYQMSWFRELAVDNGVQDIVSFALSVDRLVLRRKDTEPERLVSLWLPNQ
jgi:hypothetical protein